MYPRACPKCGRKINNRCNFSRHKKRCGTHEHRVQCPHCPKTYSRPDDLKRHVRKFHSEAAKRKAEDSAELARLELLHSNKVPKLETDESQTGGAVSTRIMKQDKEKVDLKPTNDQPQSAKRKLDEADILDDGQDDFLAERAERSELSENPLFKANLTFLPYKRQCLKGAVKKEQFIVTFDQLRQPKKTETLANGLSESLFEGVRDTILKENLPDSTRVHLTLNSKEQSNGKVQSNYLSHVKYGPPVQEFLKQSDYVHAMFESLARKMNSAQNMNPAIGFNVTLTFITYPEKGGKGPASKNPGRLPFKMMQKKKDCMIAIKNPDELCCARAIVTIKEYVDRDPHKQYRNLRDGRPIQTRLAKQLHQDAGVPEGCCGYEELEKFQAFLGPQGYKIILVDYVFCAFLFRGEVDNYSKVIYLIKRGNNLNGLRSMMAFLNRSYFCPDCCKGYNTEDAVHHSCMGCSCSSCQRTRSHKDEGGCPDFKPCKVRSIHCKDCQRDFYGPDCFKAHKEAKGKKKVSLCEKYKKCLVCCKQHAVNPKKPHRCYYDTCSHCHEFVNIYEHKCYIQRVEKELSDEDAEDEEDEKKKLPTLMVIGDIECLIEQEVEGRHVLAADLIRYATEQDPENVSHALSGIIALNNLFMRSMN